MLGDAGGASRLLRVLIVDDQELMRRGLTLLLSTSDVLEVVGEAADGREALAAVTAHQPDIVLSDARMPGMTGVELVAALRTQAPDIPVIILTTFDDEELVRGAMAAGAAGFLLKDTSTDELVHAMEAVCAGGLVIDPRVARLAMRTSSETITETNPLAVLTPAERLVAGHLATGATNGEIAAELVIAEGTVKNHVSAILRKLGQRDRTALALYLARYSPSPREAR